ncbi:MAG: crotonase/enoyl-CoA hydratase family protein [Gammaproteobacteria bacterium]|nr:crotonase/enoyl-CoA hydratase family protein [Gammaproteobacteria bacterium]
MKDRIDVTVKSHVAEVKLDRADKYNAIDVRMFEALGEAADFVAADASIRAVVLYGAGGNFCAGIDLDVMTTSDLDFAKALVTPVHPSPANVFQRAAYAWRELRMPVVAALDGVVFGGGLQIAMGADLRYSSSDARYSIMESKWGLIPDMAISTTLRHIIPPDRIKELAWSARVLAAQEALDYGLVTTVVDDPLAAAREMAAECAARSPDAIRGIKSLVNSAWQMSEADALRMEAKLQGAVMGRENQVEAVRANLEKRPPEFQD